MTSIINIADLPRPDAIESIDYDAMVDAQRAAFVAFWTKLRASNPDLDLPAYSVEMLETDPYIVIEQALTGRAMTLRARVNDALRAVLPAFAKGTDLEAVVARANVVRLTTAFDQNGKPIAWETDAQLLERYLAAFAAPAAGSEDGYIFQAASVWPSRHDIRVLNYASEIGLKPGDVAVYLLAPNGVAVSSEVLSKVTNALGPQTARPLTDVVSVLPAEIVPWTLKAHLIVRRGASPAAVVAGRRAALQAFGDRRYHIGGLVTLTGAASALWDANIIDVVLTSPVSNVPHGPTKAPLLTSVELTYEVDE